MPQVSRANLVVGVEDHGTQAPSLHCHYFFINQRRVAKYYLSQKSSFGVRKIFTMDSPINTASTWLGQSKSELVDLLVCQHSKISVMCQPNLLAWAINGVWIFIQVDTATQPQGWFPCISTVNQTKASILNVLSSSKIVRN